MATSEIPQGPPTENVELGLILRNTENASRDAKAALDATLRFITSFGGRMTAFEARIGALETRFTALEDRTTGIERGIDEVARSQHRTEQTLANIAAKLGA
jgi:hypothetical protein